MRTTRTTTWAAGAAVLGMALAGCTGSTSSSGGGGGGSSSSTGGILAAYTGASGQFVQNYNPFSPTVLGAIQGMVYEPLFFFNAQAPLGTPAVPVLGESYQLSADGTSLEVTTKSGVTWSDGKPFTARDVAFTMNTVHDTPALNTTGNAPSAKATDDTHVTLTFDKPAFTSAPSFLGQTYIVPEHIWASKKDVAKDLNPNPVGTGPMKLGSFSSQSYLLSKNPAFRDAGKLEVGGVRFTSLAGNEAATNKLLAGQLDWSGTFIPDIAKVLKPKPNLAYVASTTNQVALATCSSTALGCTGPQTDPVVRKAISAALDRDQINKLAYYGGGVQMSPTFALIGRDDQFIAPRYQPVPMTADVAAATSMLEGDGWVKGADGIYAKGGQRLRLQALVTAGYTDYIAALSVMTQQLKKAGIELQVQQVANAEFGSATGAGTFQLAITALYQPGVVPDPYYVYDTFYNSKNGGKVGTSVNPYANITRFADPDVDAALQVARGTNDLKAKAAAYATVQRKIVADMPYIPIIRSAGYTEYDTSRFTGWPTQQDLYADASPGATPSQGQVLMHLRKK